MKNCAFTICAKNYIGLAKVLEESMKKYNKDVDFYIFVADELTKEQREMSPSNIIDTKNVVDCPPALWEELTFKYDIVEFCTSIKPLCFKYILDKGYQKALYFDPDILFFSNIDEVWELLESYSAIVTPHIAYPYIQTTKATDDHGMMSSGIFNLGFLGVKNNASTYKMITWWFDRLSHHCISEIQDGFFTDQKWMDSLPWILDNGELYISRHLGWNIAPWNLKERKVIKETEDNYSVMLKRDEKISQPLVFFHYSAVNYQDLLKGIYRNRNFKLDQEDSVLIELLKIYGESIQKSDFTKYLSWKYTYNQFSNGNTIQLAYRRIYKRLVDEGHNYKSLFSSEGAFYKILKDRKLIFNPINNPERIKTDKVSNYGRKVHFFDTVTYLFVRLFGFDKYTLLCRFLVHYLKKKNYVRLLGKDFRDFSI